MKISMKLSQGSSTAHDIKVEFDSGETMNITISAVNEAIAVYKAIHTAYETGIEAEANHRLIRDARAAITTANKGE